MLRPAAAAEVAAVAAAPAAVPAAVPEAVPAAAAAVAAGSGASFSGDRERRLLKPPAIKRKRALFLFIFRVFEERAGLSVANVYFRPKNYRGTAACSVHLTAPCITSIR
jgi:hypothetical protein